MANQMQAANIEKVEKVKTGHGMTKFLIQNKNGEGANIMIRYWDADTNIPIHSHPYAEMWYVLDGEVEFGDSIYGPGSVVYIPPNVPYGPTRAPKGVSLLRYADGVGG